MKRITRTLAAVILILACTALPVMAAAGWSPTRPSGSVVSAYGTPAAAILSGPVYGSSLYYQVSPTANTNNKSFIIPSVNTLFQLNPGWTIDYVYVAANSAGQRQPGSSFLLSSSGGSMVYYFKRV